MQKYKIIFLIIYSTDVPEFSQMRELTPKYMNLYQDEIKYLFLEYKEDLTEDVIETDDCLFFKGSDSMYASIYNKSIKAMEYISTKYEFDYVIRTNMSTFWNIPNLFKLLEIKQKEKLACGYAKQYYDIGSRVIEFISGTGIIMSKDVAEIVYKNPNYVTGRDDVDICDAIYLNGIEIYDVVEYKWGVVTSLQNINSMPENHRFFNLHEDNFSDILHFRNRNPDRAIDVNNFKVLLDRVYDVKVI